MTRRKRMVGTGVGVATAATLGHGIYNAPMEFTLALGGKRGNAEIPAARIENWQRRVLYKHLPGYTDIPGLGRYTGETGPITEPTRKIFYSGKVKDYAKMRRLGRSYAKVFGQESTLMTSSPTLTRFVGGEPGKLAHTLARLMRLRRMVPR